MIDLSPYQIAVLVPCFNEEITIPLIVRDFRTYLPNAEIYVFDNNSSDNSIEVACAAGATVREVFLQGKGNVIRRMFADIDADIYIMVDGDDTYDASVAPALAQRLITNGLDMLVASRISKEKEAYRFGHRFGNIVLTQFVATIFGRTFNDMLSGYRVFSRRYVKSFPAHSEGFEIETELTVHALDLRMPVAEIETNYKARPEGSESKLNTYGDGLKIFLMIFKLFKTEKPLMFFSVAAFAFAFTATCLAIPLVLTYLETGLVPRFPTAVLCASLILLGVVLLTCGIILDTVTKGRMETKRMAYLAVPSLWSKLPK